MAPAAAPDESAQPTVEQAPLRLSIVIPAYNERDNIAPLVDRIITSLQGLDYEVIVVDDGSTDGTRDEVARQVALHPELQLVVLARNSGQTQAMGEGVRRSRGEIIAFLDSDMQNDPADIPLLLERIDAGADAVSGWRRDRKDRLLDRRLPSMAANVLVSRLFGLRIHDLGCTLKAYRREALEEIEFSNDIHRLIPLYVHHRGYSMEEVEVNHSARLHGSSKYGLGRVFNLLIDIFLFYFLSRFLRRPMHFFGKAALLLFGLGAAVATLVVVRRLVWGGDWISPAFYIAFVSVLIAVQLLLTGLICELVTRVYVRQGHGPRCRVKEVVRHPGPSDG